MTEEPSAETSENQNKKVEKQYNADDLRTMKGLEAVREKPGMYIGGTDERALHHCINEVLDNSVDEFLAGHCSHIDVNIHSDGSISIKDNGRGIPVDINKDSGLPGVEVALTVLHTGGKYGQGNYEYSGGTHGGDWRARDNWDARSCERRCAFSCICSSCGASSGSNWRSVSRSTAHAWKA